MFPYLCSKIQYNDERGNATTKGNCHHDDGVATPVWNQPRDTGWL